MRKQRGYIEFVDVTTDFPPPFPKLGSYGDNFAGTSGNTLPVYDSAVYASPPFTFGNCLIAPSNTAFMGTDSTLGVNKVIGSRFGNQLDAIAQIDALPTTNGTTVGVMYCYSEGASGLNGYGLRLVRSGGVNFGTIRRYVDGAVTDIWSEDWSEFGGLFIMGVRMYGTQHTVYTSTDGVIYKVRGSVSDGTFSSGALALQGASITSLPTCGAVAVGAW